MCFDYTFTNEYSKGVCKQDLQTGFKEQCSNCKKFSYSKDCFEKHKKLPMKYCNSVKTCVKCNLQDVMIEELQQRFINYFWGRPNWPSGPLILDP